MTKLAEPKIIKAATNILSQISQIQSKHKFFRKGSKQDFNFFEGLVNSGKSDKLHIEKYHSNFIAYLLNPQASHDCDSLFLDNFLTYLKTAKNFNSEGFNAKNTKIEVERERKTDEKRSIDITTENKSKWIIFIENKTGSGELLHQVADYVKFCKNKNVIWCGIYLTKDGSLPPSLSKKDIESKNVISLSYEDITRWLKLSMPELILYPHITSALSQYVATIKKFLNPITTQEMEEIVKLIIEKPENIEAAHAIANSLNDVNKYYVNCFKKQIEEIFQELKGIYNTLEFTFPDESFVQIKNGGGFNFKLSEWSFNIWFQFENEKLFYGIYRKDIDQDSTINKITTLFPKMYKSDPWIVWNWFDDWNNTPWKDIPIELENGKLKSSLKKVIEGLIKTLVTP